MATRIDTTANRDFVDKRVGRGSDTSVLSDPALYQDVDSLIAALQDNSDDPGPGDPDTYTDDVIAKMTKNDMVLAVRQLYDSAGIK